MMMKYQEPEPATVGELREALKQSQVETAARLVIALALHAPDVESVTQVLLEAATSAHAAVRGNAILGLGHLARRFRSLERASIERVLIAALSDPDPYVRGHASSAADDVRHFLGWAIRPH